jgi:propionyl-CoA carboxylase beta chain
MAIAPHLVEQLASRRRTALAAGGEDKLNARKEKGLMNARERLLALFQPNTFMEWGMHADHDCHDFGLEGQIVSRRRRRDGCRLCGRPARGGVQP